MRATEEPIADLTARVWDSYAGTELEPGRVVMSERRIVLATEESRTTIPLSTVFDVAPGQAPAHLGVDSGSVLSIGHYLEETRHTATFEADESVIDRLATTLFRLLLGGTDVIVTNPSLVDGVPQDESPSNATLDVSPGRIQFTRNGDTASIPTDRITGFGRTKTDNGGDLPITVRLAHQRRDLTVETDVTFGSQRTANVFGRYLREKSDGRGEGPASITVLFVDDESVFLDLFTRQLEGVSGIEAHSVTDGLDALSHMSEHPDTNCVVSDYKMPGMDGIELLTAMREVRPNLPFVLLTGMGSETVAERALAAGVSDYLRKDTVASKPEMLGTRVKRAVSDHRPHTA